MAWRDDKARATLIREAAGSVQPGKTPRTFAELLFGHTNLEDLASCDVPSLAFLAEQAWEHVQQRTTGSADIRVINPIMPDGREISVLEILNDNMPFLFDSIMAELAEQGIEVALVAHPIIAVERDEQGKLLRFYGATPPEGARAARESLIHFHIARLDSGADRQKLIDGLAKTLNDVRACVTDWRAMRARVEAAIKTLSSNPPPLPIDDVAEASQFLQWLCADNFTFLGLREYRFSSDSDALDDISTGEGLGILSDPDVKVLRRGSEMVVMTPEIREFMHEPTLLIVITTISEPRRKTFTSGSLRMPRPSPVLMSSNASLSERSDSRRPRKVKLSAHSHCRNWLASATSSIGSGGGAEGLDRCLDAAHGAPIGNAGAHVVERLGKAVDQLLAVGAGVETGDVEMDQAFARGPGALWRRCAVETQQLALLVALHGDDRVGDQRDFDTLLGELRHDRIEQEGHVVVENFEHGNLAPVRHDRIDHADIRHCPSYAVARVPRACSARKARDGTSQLARSSRLVWPNSRSAKYGGLPGCTLPAASRIRVARALSSRHAITSSISRAV